MRKWTWLVLVTSGALAWACGGDDDGGGSSNNGTDSGGSGGTGGDGGSAGNGGTGGSTSSGGTGGSGGNGGSTTSTTSSGGNGGSTTGTGGSAGGGAGDSGAAGMAGAAGAGDTGGDPPPTLEEACAASCAAQDATACPDAVCAITCPYGALYPDCEDEYIAQQACYGELEESEFSCDGGYPAPAPGKCEDETGLFLACISTQ